MGRNELNAAVVVFCVVAVIQSVGAKIDGRLAHKANVSSAGQDVDSLSLLTQLSAAVTERVSASIHHAATPENLSNMVTMALNIARKWNSGRRRSRYAEIKSSMRSRYAEIKSSMKATINNVLDVKVNWDFMNVKQRMENCDDLFASCENSRETRLTEILTLQQLVSPLGKRHTRCREQEAAKYADKKACDGSLQSNELLHSTNCNTFLIQYGQDESTSLCSRKLSETAEHRGTQEQYNRRMISEFQSRLNIIRSQQTLCQNASLAMNSQQHLCAKQDRELQEKRKSCNAIQETLDSTACRLAGKMETTCQAYHACRQQTEYSWNLSAKSAQQTVENLNEEYVTLKKVECIIDNLETNETQIKQCLEETYDTSHLGLNITQPPAYQECKALEDMPGTPLYEQAVYGVLPAEAPAGPCAASCCHNS